MVVVLAVITRHLLITFVLRRQLVNHDKRQRLIVLAQRWLGCPGVFLCHVQVVSPSSLPSLRSGKRKATLAGSCLLRNDWHLCCWSSLVIRSDFAVFKSVVVGHTLLGYRHHIVLGSLLLEKHCLFGLVNFVLETLSINGLRLRLKVILFLAALYLSFIKGLLVYWNAIFHTLLHQTIAAQFNWLGVCHFRRFFLLLN